MRLHLVRVQPSVPQIKKGWTTEFSTKNICLRSNNPARFVKCQWHYERDPCTCYLVYRWIMAVGFTAPLVCNTILILRPTMTIGAWFTRFSAWVWLTCATQMVMAAIMVSVYYVGKWRRSQRLVELSLYPYGLYWMLNTLATDLMILVCYRFWSRDYPKDRRAEGKEILLVQLFTFFISPLLIMVDFWIVSHTMKLFHIMYTLLFHLIYDIASYIFYCCGLQGSKYVVAWNHPKTRVLTLSLQNYGILILIHVCNFLMQKLRKTLYFVLWKYCRYPLEGMGNALATEEELISPKLSSPRLTIDFST